MQFFYRRLVSIHSMYKFLSFPHMKDIKLCIYNEINKFARRADGMGLGGIGKVGNTDSKGTPLEGL